LKKVFEKRFFVLKNVFENQLHKQGPNGRANLFTNYGLVLIITSGTELEIP